ncbi:MAG: thiolase family protein [Thermoplasmata archaeon]
MSVQVTGIGIARFGKRAESSIDLGTEAGTRAMEEVGRRPIDLLVVGNMLAEALEGTSSLVPRLAAPLGLESASGVRVESASATGAAAFHVAAWAIESGRSERALVVATEKMSGVPTAEVARALARSLAPSEIAAGATMPALAALVAQRYRAVHGLDDAAIDAVSVHARAQSARNPHAQFREPVRPEEVRASRTIADPLHLLHCASIADGAAALVLERGRGPATVTGLGQGLDAFRCVDRATLSSFTATKVAAERAYAMARIGPKDLGVVELHDAFAPFAMIDLEDLGVAAPGEGSRWYTDGGARPDGRLPINPSGGLLGRGHPVGVSGLCAIAEIASQLRGSAGDHQIARPVRVGLAQSIGGLASHNFVTILASEAT